MIVEKLTPNMKKLIRSPKIFKRYNDSGVASFSLSSLNHKIHVICVEKLTIRGVIISIDLSNFYYCL